MDVHQFLFPYKSRSSIFPRTPAPCTVRLRCAAHRMPPHGPGAECWCSHAVRAVEAAKTTAFGNKHQYSWPIDGIALMLMNHLPLHSSNVGLFLEGVMWRSW